MAITTDVGICNLALSLLGISKVITTLGDNTAQARACNRWYEQVRDELLQEVRWGFATKRAELNDITATGDERGDWGYAYDLPADCLVVQYIYSGVHDARSDQRVPYAIEHDTTLTQRVLLTDEGEAILVYTALLSTVTLYPPSFIRALAASLGAATAEELRVSERRTRLAEARAANELDRATAKEHTEGQDGPTADPEWLADRGA